MTAGEAMEFLNEVGLEGRWEMQSDGAPDPTCPAGEECPIPGVTADTSGCLGVSIFSLPPGSSGANPSVDVHINWWVSEWTNARYSITRPLKDIEALIQPRTDLDCIEIKGGRPSDPLDLYNWVPYTEVVQPTYWHLTEEPVGTTLKLAVAAGGSCERFERLDVEETDNSVTINAFIRHSTEGPYHGCDDSLKAHFATVELAAPLGDRPLLGCAPAEIWYVDHNRDCVEPGSD